ncbi:MAG: hypothetical protein HKO66_11925 [Saprospiraceae bacterium]|nr:hypothetical protein [Bacteroidia bacterium]NNL92937.1 hypothetical protein [Saprospiraceae bacterium]
MLKHFKEFNPILITTEETKNIFSKVDYILPGFKNSFDFITKSGPFYRKCKRLLKDLNAQFPKLVIYCPSFHPWNYLIGKIAKRLKIKFVITVHDYKLHQSERKFVRLLQNKTIALSNPCVFLTDHQMNLAAKAGFNKTIFMVLPHPLFTEVNSNNKPYNPLPNLLFVGYIKPYKGLELLSSALEELSFNKLTIAGDGELPKINLPNLNIINRKISDDELNTLIENHEFLILPYTQASQSGVLCLGLSKEINMIITEHPGLQEQLAPDCAYWSKPSKESLNQTLKRAFTNELLYYQKKKNLAQEKRAYSKSWNHSFNTLIGKLLE